LTDEEIRNNYLKYGHPDGKQSFSMGIALPKFLVAEGYGNFTLVFYLGLLGILLPYLAGKWWYGTQKYTKDGILVNSAGTLVQEYKETMDQGHIIKTLSGGEEYETIIAAERSETGLSRVETSILAQGVLSKLAGGLGDEDKRRLQELDNEGRRKILALLWAYLGRVELGDDSLNKEKFGVAPIAWQLNDAFQIICQAFVTLRPLVTSLHVSQDLLQAIPPGGSPLLQLPFFTPQVVQSVEGEESKSHLTIQQYMELPADKRKKLTVGPGLLTDKQYQTAITTARQFPAMSLEKAFFRVRGEKAVTVSSLVQLIVKVRVIPPGATNIPAVNEKELSEVDDDDEKEEAKRYTPPLAHAPYFARDHSPVWHIFLGDPKMGRVAVPPFEYSTFDKPILTEDGEPTYNVQTIKLQFGAPPQAGKYTFVMHIINDSYIGLDIKEYVTMVVEEASKAEAIEDDGEISEPGEGKFTIIHYNYLICINARFRYNRRPNACSTRWVSFLVSKSPNL
jgi:translocation protein SEC63